jgi:riboflavin synthase
MFTGIIEEAGIVHSIEQSASSIQLTIRANVCGQGLRIGDSLAVNGCCLTVVEIRGRPGSKKVRFDLLAETWNRTNFREMKTGSLVNLERSLRTDGRLDGHFVAGHIDGTGIIRRWEAKGGDWVLDIAAPPEVMDLVIFKGSIAVDGISLTVAAVIPGGLRIWIIPHTFEVTALRERKVGDAVNLESDLIGKYVRKFVDAGKPRRRSRS